MMPKNPRELALLVLDEIYERGAYANLALNKALRRNGLSSLDRKLCTELVYGTVKTTGTLDWYLCRVINRPFRKMALLRTILRMGAYQILYLERIPDSAAVNECANLARYYVNENSVKLVNGVLRQLSRTKATWQFPQKEEDATLRLALTYYHPEWLVRRWKFRFGLPPKRRLCVLMIMQFRPFACASIPFSYPERPSWSGSRLMAVRWNLPNGHLTGLFAGIYPALKPS